MYRCGTCDNNTCNAGYGEVNGETCKDCPEAYELMMNAELNLFQKFIEWACHTKLYRNVYYLIFCSNFYVIFCRKYLKWKR